MKYLAPFAAVLIMLACNNDKKSGDVTVTSENGKSPATADASSMNRAAEAQQKQAEELQKLSPYTLDQMKTLLPEELAGAKRSDISVTSSMGAPYAEGSYPINDSTEIAVKVFDCAGHAGSGIYNM